MVYLFIKYMETHLQMKLEDVRWLSLTQSVVENSMTLNKYEVAIDVFILNHIEHSFHFVNSYLHL